MGFYIDLSNITLEDLKDHLKGADLLPSRQMLKDDINKHFKKLKKAGVQNTEEILKCCPSKKKFKRFKDEFGLDEEYLTILIREIKSYRQKPIKLSDFNILSKDSLAKLESKGIKNALHFYMRSLDPKARLNLAIKTGIPIKNILKLTHLVDLSRVRWINQTFAHMLYDAGYDSAKKLAKSDYEKLHKELRMLNKKNKYFKGNIGKHDIKLCVEAAQKISADVEY